jgi:hypothetical protein
LFDQFEDANFCLSISNAFSIVFRKKYSNFFIKIEWTDTTIGINTASITVFSSTSPILWSIGYRSFTHWLQCKNGNAFFIPLLFEAILKRLIVHSHPYCWLCKYRFLLFFKNSYASSWWSSFFRKYATSFRTYKSTWIICFISLQALPCTL